MMKKDSKSFPVDGGIKAEPAHWRFSREVAQNFSTHARRSIPFFSETQSLILEASDFFLNDGARCFDLGCADGAFLTKLASRHGKKADLQFIGIDSSEPMVEVATLNGRADRRIEIRHADIRDTRFEGANLILAHYTLHFVPPHYRADIINSVYRDLELSGGFLFFEKVRAPSALFQDMANAWLNDFKVGNGFSAEEIQNKSNALKGTLVPNETEMNLRMLREAGFREVFTVFKWACFEGYLAVK